jgi:hypothetical protein
MDINKFAIASRLKWPWLHWKYLSKAWVGDDHPCNEADMDIFYATITISDGRIASFCDAPKLQGRKPKDTTPYSQHISVKSSRCTRASTGSFG